MKINEYNQMMKYLTRRKDPKKPDDCIPLDRDWETRKRFGYIH